MDKVHDIDNKAWISKRRLHLKRLIEEREAQLGPIVSLVGQETETGDKELKDELDRFVSSSEKDLKPYFLFNSTDQKALTNEPKCELKTYLLQLEHAKKMISDRAYKVSYRMKLETTRRELLMRHLASGNRSGDATHPSDQAGEPPNSRLVALVVVQIWPQPSKGNKMKLEKEVIFRSDNKLVDLRQQFKCQKDYGVPMDLSENPEQAERVFRGELFKSAFFLIGDTFYNDMRDQSNTDLSAAIIEWASKKVLTVEDGQNVWIPRGIGPFKSARMEDHQFSDLKFRLGCPYLYLHQGDCEHLFTISDIRYVVDSPQLDRIKFPYVTATSFGGKMDNLRCYMCKHRAPHWYTRNNERLPVDPFFFCEACFSSFNYDKDKKKIGKFQAYLFTSASGIPDNVAMASSSAQET